MIEASLPKGVADFPPEMADRIALIDGKIRRVFELWGFRGIITPLLEFQEVMSIGLGEELKDKTFRLDDRYTGRLLAVPSDITPQVARIVATRMRGYPLPHRLCYSGRVLRHAEIQSGRSREIFQAGVELIGLDSPEADAEMVVMAVEVLKELGFRDFKVDIGQVDFFRGLMADAGVDSATLSPLREAISKKEISAVRSILENEPMNDAAKEAISALPRLFGGREVVVEAASIARGDRARRALDNVMAVLDILDIYGVADYITVDLGEIRGLDYHTGLTFEGFVTGVGEAVCSGGRYDDLTAKYGCPAPATGFAFNLLALLSALERQPGAADGRKRDVLLFNLHSDRRMVLELARELRGKGFSAARDIIRRDYDESLAYARRGNFNYMIVLGGGYCTDDEVYMVRVADGIGRRVKKDEMVTADGRLAFES